MDGDTLVFSEIIKTSEFIKAKLGLLKRQKARHFDLGM